MSLFIGIDSGTQSTKAVLVDVDAGAVVAQARAPHTLIEGLPPGAAEQHPGEWTAAMDQTIREVLAHVDRTRVRGIGISGQQHGFVPLDAEGQVIRPAKLWCDTGTAEECALLTRKLGGEKAIVRKIGLPFLPGYTAPKILWLKRHEPKNYQRLRHVLLPHDYLNFHLTGHYRMEPGDASGTALLDIRRRTWSSAAINAIDPKLAEWLPPLFGSDMPHGSLRPDRARDYGLSETVVVSAGGGDNMMGAIGTGNVRPGVVTASLGTSGTIYAHSTKPVVDPAGEIAAFCGSTGGWMPLLCTMNVTTITESFRGLFGFDHAALDQAVSSVPPGAEGLLLLPFFAGERTPNLPQGSGVAFGLTASNTTPAHWARAAMEGVTFGLNFGLERLRRLGLRPKEIRVTGGGARSPVWRQLMADMFGVPVVGMRDEEGAALGAALQAAWCEERALRDRRAPIARFTDRLVALNESTRCEPNKSVGKHYREWQKFQESLVAAARPMFSEHRRLL
ncbi:MAG TPA: xylulokinase [Opitutaceae bacterium]|jgi:xylulokinase